MDIEENEIKIVTPAPNLKAKGDFVFLKTLSYFGLFMLLLIEIAFLDLPVGIKIISILIGSFILMDIFRTYKRSIIS